MPTNDRPRLYPPDPDDAALPEPWPPSDATAILPPVTVADDDPEADDVTALARAWDAPSARGTGPTTDEDEGEGEGQGDANHIPVGPPTGHPTPRYGVEGYGAHDFAIVEIETGKAVKRGIRNRCIAEGVTEDLNAGLFEVEWIDGEAIILASGVKGEASDRPVKGFPHPRDDDDDAGVPADTQSPGADAPPIVGPGEWPWPPDARVGLGPEADAPGGFAGSDAALFDSLEAYDEGRRRWRLRAWLAGATGLVLGVLLGVLICWAAVEACLAFAFGFGA